MQIKEHVLLRVLFGALRGQKQTWFLYFFFWISEQATQKLIYTQEPGAENREHSSVLYTFECSQADRQTFIYLSASSNPILETRKQKDRHDTKHHDFGYLRGCRVEVFERKVGRSWYILRQRGKKTYTAWNRHFRHSEVDMRRWLEYLSIGEVKTWVERFEQKDAWEVMYTQGQRREPWHAFHSFLETCRRNQTWDSST